MPIAMLLFHSGGGGNAEPWTALDSIGLVAGRLVFRSQEEPGGEGNAWALQLFGSAGAGRGWRLRRTTNIRLRWSRTVSRRLTARLSRGKMSRLEWAHALLEWAHALIDSPAGLRSS